MKHGPGVVALAVIGAALALAAGAGCGGDSGGGARLSKQEYARQANALCTSYRKRASALSNPAGAGGSIRKLEQALSLSRRFDADLSKLNPPLGEDAKAKRLGRLLEEQTDVLEQLVGAYKKKDWLKVYALADALGKSGKGSTELFRQLGLTECNKS
jgi:hypothetical protein